MTGQMSVAEEKILTVPKEELFELCRRFTEGRMTEEEWEEGFDSDDVFEKNIPKRDDISLEDLFSVFTMMTETPECILEDWSVYVIPERFSALTFPKRLDFLEKIVDQFFSCYLANELLEKHLGLPEGSAVSCIIRSKMGNALGSEWSGVDEKDVLKSLVKLIRLEMQAQ